MEDEDALLESFDGAITNGGKDFMISVEGGIHYGSHPRFNWTRAFRMVRGLIESSDEKSSDEGGRLLTVGIFTREEMLPLLELVDVAIRVPGIGPLNYRRQDIWLPRGTTLEQVLEVATEEE
ncbi:MAG: hypothetical protein EOR16_31975 [Mesorhizobium sp.]|uniref:hypothetical protein n=1 Tax=Mesorhizobium sp. TaxID=1871066 RepID=UPI000FE9695A|nr:hypothetical protein [Mesorhizobium sp.]RWI49125.1 MAG: hypothetical protein EOR16_31975 [Mesorhizobium sp.]